MLVSKNHITAVHPRRFVPAVRRVFDKNGCEDYELVDGEISLMINSELDVFTARDRGRWMAQRVGFRGAEVTLLATLISDLARKLMSSNGGKGHIVIQSICSGARKGISVTGHEQAAISRNDDSPRQADRRSDTLVHDRRFLKLARQSVADEFEIKSVVPTGSVVRMVKWL